MDNDKIIVCPLTEKHKEQATLLDNLSWNDISEWLDIYGYAWGIFQDDLLIGYCTLGLADILKYELEDFKEYSPDDLLLSDVFIHPLFRQKGYAIYMVNEAIKQKMTQEENANRVFLTLLDDDLQYLYQHCGFKMIHEGLMVR